MKQKLSNLIEHLDIKLKINIDDDKLIKSIVYDTKKVQKGSIFVCIKGTNIDSHMFAKTAIDKGAICLICEDKINDTLPQIIVNDSRIALSTLCKYFYNCACDKLKIIGVTGTNGKTSTTHILANMLINLNKKVAIIGTSGIKFKNKLIKTNLTTPNPDILHKTFNYLLKKGCEYVCMEVSAHSLSLNKLVNIEFTLGIFTNLSEDHFDFYNGFEDYFLAKQKMFTDLQCNRALINIDDEYGIRLYNNLKDSKYSYSLFNVGADYYAENVICNCNSSNIEFNVFNRKYKTEIKLLGMFNVYNVFSSISAMMLLGFNIDMILNACKKLSTIKGRFDCQKKINSTIIIDYAHSPDSLEKILLECKKISNNKVICVFGCGGNRDKKKRAIMGNIASNLADKVILTNDNPRNEEPMDIINDIVLGIEKDNYQIILNRSEAIKKAYLLSNPGDIIAICGKGDEPYMEIFDKKIKYCDYDIVKKLK